MKKYILILLIALSVVACDKGFEEPTIKEKEINFNITSEANIHQIDLDKQFSGLQLENHFFYIYNPTNEDPAFIGINANYRSKTTLDNIGVSLKYNAPKKYFNDKTDGIASLNNHKDLPVIISNKDYLSNHYFNFDIIRNDQTHHYTSFGTEESASQNFTLHHVEILTLADGKKALSLSGSFNTKMYKANLYSGVSAEFNIDFTMKNGRLHLLIPLEE